MHPTLSRVRQTVKDLLESRLWPRRPQTLNFEITAACDAKCIHCPRQDMDRAMKPMPLGLFRKMIDEADALGIPELCPNGFGEICTIPMPVLREYFGHIAVKPRRFKILINTNGNRMTEERCELFLAHKVHLVNVTIDGATAETAESIRVGLDFHRIETNIKTLLAMRNRAGLSHPKVRVSMVAMPQTAPEYGLFEARWRGIADYVGMGGFSSRLESVAPASTRDLVQLGQTSSPATIAPTDGPVACVLPFSTLNIWADGKAVVCCEDWNEEMVVGDLSTQSIDEIWHGPEMAEVRRKHRTGRGGEVPICAKCNLWREPTWGARLWG